MLWPTSSWEKDTSKVQEISLKSHFAGNYPKITFVGIENIHKMRDSIKKFRKVCLREIPLQSKIAKLPETKWLDHIAVVMQGAALVVDLLSSGTAVVVHCSDGMGFAKDYLSLRLGQNKPADWVSRISPGSLLSHSCWVPSAD